MHPQNRTYTLFNIADILGSAPSTPYKYLQRYQHYLEPYQISGTATRFSYQGLILFQRIYRWSIQDKLTISQIRRRLARMYPGIQNQNAINLRSATATEYFIFWNQSQNPENQGNAAGKGEQDQLPGWLSFISIADISLCLITLILVIILIFS